MRLSACLVLTSCLLVGLSSAWPSKDTNRGFSSAWPSKDTNRACKYGGDPDHTMCTTSPAAENGADENGMPMWQCPDKLDIRLRGINAVGQQDIIDHLNKRRNEVAGGKVEGQPPAANMKKLVFSEELATIAQRWADQCHYDKNKHNLHDDDHRATSDGTMTGQNGYIGDFKMQINDDSMYGDYDYKLEEDSDRAKTYVYWNNNDISELSDTTYAVFMEGIGQWTELWFDENKLFTSSPQDPYVFEDKTGHYTQLAWADAGEVGCGWNFIEVSKNYATHFYKSLMFCNFSPSGNMSGGQIYEIGEGATKCPAGFSKDEEYPNLCSQ